MSRLPRERPIGPFRHALRSLGRRVAGLFAWNAGGDAFDSGWHAGHRAGSGSTKSVEHALEKARRSRRNPLVRFFLPLRRRFLDGFIEKLELELEHRSRGGQQSFVPAEPTSPRIEIHFRP